MSQRLQVFVSSVQKELEDERLIVQNLMNTDPFLSVHCASVLYELEPASPDKALDGCLKALDAGYRGAVERTAEANHATRPSNGNGYSPLVCSRILGG